MADADKLPRLAKVDQIGDVDELVKQHANPLKTEVKLRMDERDEPRVTGDRFEGLLVKGRVGTIDPEKYFKSLEKKKVPRAKQLAGVRVSNEAAAEVLTGEEIERVSTFKDSSPSLRITRIKGVEIALVDALQRLNETIRAGGS